METFISLLGFILAELFVVKFEVERKQKQTLDIPFGRMDVTLQPPMYIRVRDAALSWRVDRSCDI